VEFAATLVEIEKIATAFAKQNPGYFLYANTQVRSLEQQLERWQKVQSVAIAARELERTALAYLAKDDEAPTPASLQRFLQFLIQWRASRTITLAAPGFSLHGQGRAYDFQVRDAQGRTVAGPDSATIQTAWRRSGWAERVAIAVRAGSDAFVGPLARPDEPWHFEYRPTDPARD
jgi:hypothetical protein